MTLLYSAGCSSDYRLGRPTSDKSNEIPSPVNINAANIVCCAAGWEHSVVVYSDGSVIGWGSNYNNQIGFSERKYYKTPTVIDTLKNVKIIWASCGDKITTFLTDTGDVYVANEETPSDKPYKLKIPIKCCYCACTFDRALAIGNDGSLYMSSSPPTKDPVHFTFPKPIYDVIGGRNYILALTVDHVVYGYDEVVKCKEFKPVESLTNIKIQRVFGGLASAAVVDLNGVAYTWGCGSNGRLGHGDENDLDNFKAVEKLRNKKIVDIDMGNRYTVFIDSEGNVYSCGASDDGELMNGKKGEFATPELTTLIKGRAVYVACGEFHTFVLTGDKYLIHPGMKNFHITESITSKNTKSQEDPKTVTKKEVKKREDNFFIGNDDEKFFENKGKIGEGATSITYKVIDTRTKIPMCKKVLKITTDQTSFKSAQNALKEFEVLYRIDHPCVCKSYFINTQESIQVTNGGNTDETTTISLYLEYLEYGLGQILKSKINNTLKVKIVIEIAHAMNFIHSHGLIHRDLKIENIMLNSIMQTKLVDFGLVRINECFSSEYSLVEDSLTKGIGTFAYMSPEMLNEENYDNKTDVYSFGIVLYYMFFGSIPKQNLKDKTSGKKIKLPSPSSSASKFCLEIIGKCLEPVASNRPSFKQILDDIRKNSFELADEVDFLILSQVDNQLIEYAK